MSHSCERRERLSGDRIENLAGISEVLGEASPDLEMQGRLSSRAT
jgi:hypothetical protein